jgi:hypothetical protein
VPTAGSIVPKDWDTCTESVMFALDCVVVGGETEALEVTGAEVDAEEEVGGVGDGDVEEVEGGCEGCLVIKIAAAATAIIITIAIATI